MSSANVTGQVGRRVLLFSGHMIDSPKREAPRFPPALEPAVDRAIRAEIDRLATGPADVAISSAACGSDTLFLEAVLARGARARIYLPFEEPEFLKQSVTFADARWEDRHRAVVGRSECFVATQVLGPLPDGTDPFARTNLWMLDEAKRIGGKDIVFLCVWNGKGGDGPGGTQHMIDAVGAEGAVVRIDSSDLLARQWKGR